MLRDVFIVCNNVEEPGGVQRFTHTLASLLHDQGHRVHVVGISHPLTPERLGVERAYDVHVLLERYPPSPDPRRGRPKLRPRALRAALRRRRWIRRGARQLSRLFATAQPGGVVVCTQVWAMEWVRAADTHGMPVIAMSHESFAASQASSRGRRIRHHYADVDRFLLLTEADAALWTAAGLPNTGAMPNPLTIEPAGVAALTGTTVVALGRLAPEKGFDLLLQAWQTVAQRHPKWSLRIFGTGPEEERLRALVDASGLESSVALLGHTVDVARELLDASMLVLPSRAEGWPLVLAEAMASGVPCVSFDCAPSIREIITDGVDGLVVPAGDTTALGEAICQMIEDEPARREMGRRATGAVGRFAPEVIRARWERELDLVHGVAARP